MPVVSFSKPDADPEYPCNPITKFIGAFELWLDGMNSKYDLLTSSYMKLFSTIDAETRFTDKIIIIKRFNILI